MTKLTTKQKDNLKKVCLVLFEEYSKVKIRNNGRVIFSGRKKSNIPRRSKYNYTFLIDHFLPQRLAMFKYDNIDFLNVEILKSENAEFKADLMAKYDTLKSQSDLLTKLIYSICEIEPKEIKND